MRSALTPVGTVQLAVHTAPLPLPHVHAAVLPSASVPVEPSKMSAYVIAPLPPGDPSCWVHVLVAVQ
jgi:hypothetical protein